MQIVGFNWPQMREVGGFLNILKLLKITLLVYMKVNYPMFKNKQIVYVIKLN